MAVYLADKAELAAIDSNWRAVVSRNSDNAVRNLTLDGLRAAVISGLLGSGFVVCDGSGAAQVESAAAARTRLGLDSNDNVTFGDVVCTGLTILGESTVVDTEVTVRDPLIKL